MTVQIGDKVRRLPYALTEGCIRHELVEGTVVWVHPAERFHVVEFRFPQEDPGNTASSRTADRFGLWETSRGGTFRESFDGVEI